MFNNVLSELILVEEYYDEYLSLINTYQNFNRQSVFCRYYNINRAFSTSHIGTDSTFDHFQSGITYDTYEYMPLFYASQVVNDAQDQPDLMGQMFLGNLNVIIYTLEEPLVNDLITFPYKPNAASEIFRVTNIRVAINGKTSKQKINWYELTLETAPISDLDKLKLTNRWVYSLNLQKNIMYDDFERMVKELTKIEGGFKTLNKSFDQSTELFYYIDPVSKQKIVPLAENAMIFDLLATVNGYFREFNDAFVPYGVDKYGTTGNMDLVTRKHIDYTYDGFRLYDDGYDVELGKIIVRSIVPDKINILSYEDEFNIFSMAVLLNTWVWKNSIPYKSQYTEFIDPDQFARAGFDKQLELARYDDERVCPKNH